MATDKLAAEMPALNDDQILEVVKECFPWQTEAKINDLLTYEKSPPLFPQATYDVPSYRAERFVRAVEKRIHAACEATITALEAENKRLREVLEPFKTFAEHAVEQVDDSWVWRTSGKERICDWFGPSDFGAARDISRNRRES